MRISLSEAGRRKHVLLACLLLAVEPAFLFIGPVAGVALFGGWNPKAMYVTACIVNFTSVALVCLLYLRRLGTDNQFRIRALDMLCGVMSTVCFYPLAMLLSELSSRMFPSDQVLDAVQGSTALGPAVAWIIMAMLPALSEEFLFRGVLFGAFRRYGFWAALTVSSVSFALAHDSVPQICYTLLMGVIWGWVRERTGSVWPGMLGHMAFNSVALLAAFQPGGAGSGSAAGTGPGLVPLALLAAAMGLGGALLLKAMARYSSGKAETEPVWRTSFALAALAVACHMGLSYLIGQI